MSSVLPFLKSIEPVGLVFEPFGIFKSLSVNLPLSQINKPFLETLPATAGVAVVVWVVGFFCPLNSLGIFATALFGNIFEMIF